MKKLTALSFLCVLLMLTGCPSPVDHNDSSDFIPVTDIIGIPHAGKKDTPIHLADVKVVPEDATNRVIIWSKASDSGVDLTMNLAAFTPIDAGTLKLVGTVNNGAGEGAAFTKTFTLTIEDYFAAVTDIANVPKGGVKGAPIDLSAAEVVPANANNKTIVWTIKDQGRTALHRGITGNEFIPDMAGKAIITGTVTDGEAPGADFIKDFTLDIAEKLIPVQNIEGVPGTGSAGTLIDLSQVKVVPEDATNNVIVWSAAPGSAVQAQVNGAAITPESSGVLSLSASIAQGLSGSQAYTKTFQLLIAPAAPKALKLSPGDGQIEVSWDEVPGAAAYEVWYGTGTDPESARKFGGDLSGPSLVINELANGTLYYVWVKAKNSAGTSGFSAPANASPKEGLKPPQAPAKPTVSPGNGLLTVSWTPVEGAGAYKVYFGESAALRRQFGEDITGTSATITGLENDATYYVWIKAKNSAGESPYSPGANGIPEGPPSALASSVSLSHETLSLTVGGDPFILTATISPAGAEGLTWSSDNIGVASVNSGGEVRPAGKGSARIRATAVNGGVYAECLVTVSGLPGLYEGSVHREDAGTALETMLAWIAANGEHDTVYTLTLGANEDIPAGFGIGTGANNPTTGAKKNLTILLEAADAPVAITMTGQGALFTVQGNTSAGDLPTLILDSGVTLKGNADNNSALLVISGSGNPAKLEMRDGSRITGNVSSDANGGGVRILNGSEFTMLGGSIDHNKTSNNIGKGGGVYSNSSVFTMKGGTISDNEAGNPVAGTMGQGGGVYSTSGAEFTMEGGEIINNKAVGKDADGGFSTGGGVYASTTFIMSGTARIAGNQAKAGAGVHADNVFTMTGGVIENNVIYAEYTAALNPYIYGGAGVFIYNVGAHKFIKTGGVIRGMTGAGANKIADGLLAFTYPVEAIQVYFANRRTSTFTNKVYYWKDGAGESENINLDVSINSNRGDDPLNVITSTEGLTRVDFE